jgi:hypothetical protein
MRPLDLRWQDILALLQVPAHRNVFVLGSFASRVTVYSQQIRALNLIDALVSTGRIRRASSVAVVGAGAGGLTAASALIGMGLKDVWLFESQGSVLPIQRSSRARYLHPHIYDWPSSIITDTEARLPVLNWSACYASELAAQFATEWTNLCTIQAMDAGLKGRARVTLASNDYRVASDVDAARQFDLVILAVGFGVETPSNNSYPYWADLPADDPLLHTRSWLISGAGDGALTDVMRLGFRTLNHDEILKRVVTAAELQPLALEELSRRLGQGQTGAKLFEGFDPDGLVRELPLRDDAILLNTDEATLFGTEKVPARTSVLNRLIAWALQKKEKVKLRPGRVNVADIELVKRTGSADDALVWHVPLLHAAGPEVIETQQLLIRHGPVPPFSRDLKVPPDWLRADTSFWRSLKTLQRKWQELYARGEQDPTLQREHWSDGDFSAERLPFDFGPGSALVLHNEAKPARGLINSVASAVGTLENPTVTKARVEPLSVDSALANPRAFGHAIRALCEAPVLVVDITQQDVGLLLLLGIRAASRRGITVAIVCDEMSTKRWDELPFNLRSLRIVADPKPWDRRFELALARCLRTGKYRSSQRSDYLDLPVFDVVRDLGVRPDEYGPLSPAVQTLVLCPFDEGYGKEIWPEVQRAVHEIQDTEEGASEGPARRALDLESPEILERRLYEAIRRCDACIVDLTLDRGNVYFELGVRLAVSHASTRVIRAQPSYAEQIASLPVPTSSGSSAKVDALLGTSTYVQRSLRDALRNPNPGNVTGSFVFDTVRDAVTWEVELSGRGVEDTLRAIAVSTVGIDPIKDAMSPLLFSDNPGILKQARRLALESKIALALYLVFRWDEPASSATGASASHLLDELEAFQGNVELTSDERQQVKSITRMLRERLEKT